MRAVFVRCGWMKWCAGSQKGDEKPLGGGEYNRDHGGHERWNFDPVGGKVFGYFQSRGPGGGFNLGRIDPAIGGAGAMNDVLVIFVATHPTERGQRVVGWYRSGKVHTDHQPAPIGRREGCGYQMEADVADAVLLPLASRTWPVPTGARGMGQTHVRYLYDDTGRSDRAPWMDEIIAQIEAYAGPNIMGT